MIHPSSTLRCLTSLAVKVCFLAAGSPVQAQTQLPSKGAYMNVQGGWAIGGTTSGALALAAGGARLHRWGLGLASGIDNDNVTSVPILADVRWVLHNSEHGTLDVFSQQGWNFVTMSQPEYARTTYSGGPFWYGGISCKIIPTSKTTGIWLNAGVSYKQYHYQRPYEFLVPTPYSGPQGQVPPAINAHKEWRGVFTLCWGWR